MKILVIGDSHAKPIWDRSRTQNILLPWDLVNARYDALGKFICDTRPDVVVNIGDNSDMKSISSYDKGKRSSELQRLDLDIEAGRDAIRRVTEPIRQLQAAQRAGKRAVYNPRLILCTGNHEFRYHRLVNDQPLFYDEAAGESQQDVAGAAALGWEVYPFLKPVEVEGVYFAHFFTSGIMGRAIGGEHPAHSMLKLMHRSCVAGHSHLFDMSTRGHQIYGRITAVQVGCFFGFHEDYAGPANEMWWRGLVELRNVQHGDYTIHQHSYREVMENYGNRSILY